MDQQCLNLQSPHGLAVFERKSPFPGALAIAPVTAQTVERCPLKQAGSVLDYLGLLDRKTKSTAVPGGGFFQKATGTPRNGVHREAFICKKVIFNLKKKKFDTLKKKISYPKKQI